MPGKVVHRATFSLPVASARCSKFRLHFETFNRFLVVHAQRNTGLKHGVTGAGVPRLSVVRLARDLLPFSSNLLKRCLEAQPIATRPSSFNLRFS